MGQSNKKKRDEKNRREKKMQQADWKILLNDMENFQGKGKQKSHNVLKNKPKVG